MRTPTLFLLSIPLIFSAPNLFAGYTVVSIGNATIGNSSNANGQYISYEYVTIGGTAYYHAFRYQNGVGTDLGTLKPDNSGYSYATSINNSGQVAGYATTSTGYQHAFLYQSNGPMQDLGTFMSGNIGYSAAYSINNSGHVVGYASTSNFESHAFLYQNGQMQDLGTFMSGNNGFSFAYGINDANQVVGESQMNSGLNHAFLYQNGLMQDLNDLLSPDSGWILQNAYAINSLGQITGYGYLNGQSSYFLMTPTTDTPISTPAPAGLLLGLIGTATLGLVHRIRRYTNTEGSIQSAA